MPDDNRLDLSVDLNKLGDGLIDDLKKATEEVKSRRASDKVRQAKTAEKEKSRKLSAIIVAVGAVVVLLIAYFVVFAKTQAPAPTTSPYAQSQSPAPAIKPPSVTTTTPNTANATRPATPTERSSQVIDHPSNDYEQPSDRSGM